MASLGDDDEICIMQAYTSLYFELPFLVAALSDLANLLCWFPQVLLGFSTLLGASPIVDLIGIFVGHVYFYLEDIMPKIPGR
jgi:hypothetical protein